MPVGCGDDTATGVLALVAAAVAVLAQDSDRGAEERVLLEPIGSAGPDPFSDPVDPEPGETLLAFAEGADGSDGRADEPDDPAGAERTPARVVMGGHDFELDVQTGGQIFEFDVRTCRLDPEPGISLELRGASDDLDVHLRFGWDDDAPAHVVAIELHTSARQGGWFLSEQLSGYREFVLEPGFRQSIGDSTLSYGCAERTVFARGIFTWVDDAEGGATSPIEEDIVIEAACP